MERTEFNTNFLQKTFPEIYKNFFIRNDLIISGCFNFSWSPLSSAKHVSNFIRIKSKMPIKCYLGIKKRKDDNIVIKKALIYNIIKNDFEEVSFEKINSQYQKIIEFIKSISYKTGFEFEILSEISRGHSFGFSGTLGALISYGINKFLKKYNENEVFINGWKIDYIGRFGNSNGENVIKTLDNNSGITYYITEKMDGKNDILDLDKIEYQFEQIGNNTKIPLDYLMIFSGIPTDTQLIEYYKFGDSKEFEKNEEYLNKTIKLELLKKSNFFKFTKNNIIFETISDSLSILNINTLQIIDEIFSSGYKNDDIEKLINNINQYRNATSIIENQSNFADLLIYNFQKNKSNPEEKIGITPAYYGKLGGGYVVVMKSGISRNTINKTIQDLKNFYPNIKIEYSSYLDGECNDGVIVEQFISNELFSNYIQKHHVLFKNNKDESYIGGYDEIIKKELDCIIFDTISNKIYYNGEKLTSKDISSQNATIEILTLLLENIGKEISNKELPLSSYSKNKNEMIGKIIAPIINFIKSNFKIKFPLTCSGTIYDFSLKLDNSNIKIGIIKKIS